MIRWCAAAAVFVLAAFLSFGNATPAWAQEETEEDQPTEHAAQEERQGTGLPSELVEVGTKAEPRSIFESMVPVGVGLLAGTGVLAAIMDMRAGWNWLAPLGLNLAALVVMLWQAAQTKQPVTGRQTDLPDIRVTPA